MTVQTDPLHRFFVASSSPVELVLSQNGNGLEATKSSSELELDDSQNILGQVYLIQYNLDVGKTPWLFLTHHSHLLRVFQGPGQEKGYSDI